MKVLEKQDLEDLLVAAKILGTGGGGDVERARSMIEEIYTKNKQFRLVNVEDIPDEEIVVIVGIVGGGVSEEALRKVADLPRIKEKPEFAAKRALAEFIGKEPYAYLPSEIGAANTLVPMYVAAMTDGFAVDADACGRAKPEISISTTHVKGLPVTPLSIVTPFGDIMILKKAVNDARAEDLCREMAVASGGLCGVARCPVKGRDIKEAVVPNSISQTMKIGKEIREAKERGKDPVTALIESSNGFKLFHGKVKSYDREEEGGFMWGNIIITGIGDYEQDELRVWYKNEFLITWKNGKPLITCPDAIYIVDANSGEGLSAWGEEFRKAREVVIVGRKAHKLWRTEKGLQLFSPKHFGFNIEYTPIERIVSRIK